MDFEYFDIHSHLSFQDYDADREEIISEMKENKIATISIGTNILTSKRELSLANKHDNIFACVGEHPEDLNLGYIFDDEISKMAKEKKVVAVGECGLDYSRLGQDESKMKSVQRDIFEKHIDLSLEVGKPLMLHIRGSERGNMDAYIDTLDILENRVKTSGSKLRGNSHFFVGDIGILKRFLDVGFSVSFTGVITFARDYDECIRYTPRDLIMSETDSPFVSPEPFRGKRNSPVYVKEVVKKLAEIRGENELDIRRSMVQNALKFFNIFV